MNTFQRVASLAILIPCAATAQGTDTQNPSAVVDKAVAAWAKVHSLAGTFEQTLTNALLRSTAQSQGEFKQERPNKLAIRFTQPAGDAIVADGKFIWVYLQQASPGQVLKRPADAQLDVPIDISQFLDSPKDKYDFESRGAQTILGRPAQGVALRPKKGLKSPFSLVVVWVDDADGLIRQLNVAEANGGSTREIRLTKVSVNPALSAADFVFTVPKGVKVVTPK